MQLIVVNIPVYEEGDSECKGIFKLKIWAGLFSVEQLVTSIRILLSEDTSIRFVYSLAQVKIDGIRDERDMLNFCPPPKVPPKIVITLKKRQNVKTVTGGVVTQNKRKVVYWFTER